MMDEILRFLNLLLIPVFGYVVVLERRITRLETKCAIYFNNGKTD